MLRRRLESQPEVLQDFELAAEDKYWAGLQLLLNGHEACAVYLLGYTAEMILKYASFRITGALPATPVAGRFGPIRSWMQFRNPSIPRESYHSLWFWMHFLRGRRRELGYPFAPEFDAQLVRRVRRLYQTWWVEMRYRPDLVRADESVEAYDHVSWLRASRVRLWS